MPLSCLEKEGCQAQTDSPWSSMRNFFAKLTPVLKLVYDESLANGKLPQTLTQATISVLLKKR